MAVSGRKLSDFPGSINVSSAEDFDHSCEPCLTDGQHVEAFSYCLDCKEYLCNNCFRYHQKTKALKDHHLLNKDNIEKKGIPKTHSEVCTEKCHIHTDEVIKFFCLNHEELACHDCVSLNHRSCALDYIPDKCADIGDSEEFRKTAWLLSMKMAEVNYVKEKATNRGKEIDKYNEDLIKGIDEFQKKISDRIQQIRKEIKTEIDKKESLDKQTIQRVLDSCTSISSDIGKLQTKLQESKTTKQNGKLYIAIKQSMSKLKADEIKRSEHELDKTKLQNRFEPNLDLQALLSKREGFGKLSTTLVTLLQKQVKLTKKREINIRTQSDQSPSRITGCAVLSSNNLVLVDSNNKKLKVLDTQRNLVVAERKLDSSPWDVTTLPLDQTAVTFPAESEILVMTTDNKLSTIYTISTKGKCNGLHYHKGYLYVVCTDPRTVVIRVLDTKGTVYNTISLDTMERSYCFLAVSTDSKLMYVSNLSGPRIVSITLQGKISVSYMDTSFPGMTVLGDGSLLVCCLNGTIDHISADLKQKQKILGDLQQPWSICYNNKQHEVYIGSYEYDKLKVLSLQYCSVLHNTDLDSII